MKSLVLTMLVFAVSSVNSLQDVDWCINNQDELDGALEESLNSQPHKLKEVEDAFVPDLRNASSFLVPRFVYVLFTCNSSGDVLHIINEDRAIVLTTEYLFVYIHPALLRLVSLLDVTELGPSVYTLRFCIPKVCYNTSNATMHDFEEKPSLDFVEAVLKIRERVFVQKLNIYSHILPEGFATLDTWKYYLDHAGYAINLHEKLSDTYSASYCIYIGVFFLSLFGGIAVTVALQVIDKLVAHETSADEDDMSIPVFYRRLGIYSGIVCCHILFMTVYYLFIAFKELSTTVFPDVSYFGIVCYLVAYISVWVVGFSYAFCLPYFISTKFFNDKLDILIRRKSCGWLDTLVLGFVLTFCTIIFYHFLFGLIVFLYYPLPVISIMISRLTYLSMLGLCVVTVVHLYMTFGICYAWIYFIVFIQIFIISLYYSVLFGVAGMFGIGYAIDNVVFFKYIIAELFVSAGALVISYYVYAICCKPLFYYDVEMLKKKEHAGKETVVELSQIVDAAGSNPNETVVVKTAVTPLKAPDEIVYFAGGMLLIKNGSVTWIPVNQK